MSCGALVPQPGIEPVSLALEGKVLTTGPLGKYPHISHLEGAARWFPQRGAGHFPKARSFAVVSLLELYT